MSAGARASALRRARHAALDAAPTIVLVGLFTLLALLSPWLGGPAISPPGAGPDPGAALGAGLAWGLVSLLVALFVSRALALGRGLRGGARPGRPLPATRRTLVRMIPGALAAVSGMLLVRLLMPVFLGFKSAIPELHAFGRWDALLVRADRFLHLGTDPWRILHPILGHPAVTAAVDAVYVGWYQFGVVAYVALLFWLRGPRRGQLLLSFASVWVFLGVLLATGMASVGPCYLDRLVGGETAFTPLMSYLGSVDAGRPLHALALQEELWRAYETGDDATFFGIAAMPSLHVALPALFAVAAWHRSRRLSLALWLYTTVILLGSIHLGWHYAVDGYASMLLVFPIWWAAGVVSRRWYAATRGWRWGWGERRRAEATAAAPRLLGTSAP